MRSICLSLRCVNSRVRALALMVCAFFRLATSTVVDASYDGPTITFPITESQVKDLIAAFKSGKKLHKK